MKTLRERVAVVTGGGSGIGRALAQTLAAEGCHLALADVSEAGMAETAARLAPSGVRVTTHVTDVANREAMRALPDAVLAAHGAVHVVVNNAGITALARFDELTEAELDRIVGVNFWGVVHGCRFFLPHLQRADEAHLVNTSSMAAFTGMPFQTMYCATKSAVRGFSQALRAELGGSRIGLTTVFPTAVRSNIMGSASGPHQETVRRLSGLLQRHGYPAERAARKIVRAVRRGRPEVRIGGQSYAIDVMQRLSPRVTRALMRLIARQADRLLAAPPA
jgi:NAD(P)-dependent dehydrogenase (short-subunit alcohol dehydrogenase family)